jgi:hypothetical protein
VPLDLGRGGALITRDGEWQALGGRSARITVGEAPVYVRQGWRVCRL